MYTLFISLKWYGFICGFIYEMFLLGHLEKEMPFIAFLEV